MLLKDVNDNFISAFSVCMTVLLIAGKMTSVGLNDYLVR